MEICATINEIRAGCHLLRATKKRLGLVPTMGALHEGHNSLVRAAKAQCDAVVVSIFVNPTQFGPTEDLARYPRPFERDRKLLEKEGIEILFVPTTGEMYSGGEVTWVTVEGLSAKLDGRSRPGHFRGVTTVVAKLFNIVQPDVAFFGQKDAAQVAVIRRMVRDLNFPVEIAVCPIVRESDGLALSSRNVYLGPDDRRRALVLHRSLRRVEQDFRAGEKSASRLIAAARQVFADEPQVELEYFEIVDPDTLDPVEQISGQTSEPTLKTTLVAVAARVGGTRLIDNILLKTRP